MTGIITLGRHPMPVNQGPFARAVNRSVKEHFQANRPFLCLVIGPDGGVTCHSNMDNEQERLELVGRSLLALRGQPT